MEKQRINRTSGFIKRLLISFSLFGILSFSLFSREITYAELKTLRFIPTEDQNFYTDTDIEFQVILPGIKPSEIKVLQDRTQMSQKNISFKSMKKFEDFSLKGTVIQIWYSMDKIGTYTISPLKVTVQNKKTSIKFDPITVTEDPAKMMPKIVIVFSNGAKVKSDDTYSSEPLFSVPLGEKLRFTVYLQYITQLVQFNFEIPKDSIYKQVKTYEITEVKYREKSISNEMIPVADFEWEVLTEGKHTIPQFKLTTIDYNGYRTELMLPEVNVEFTPRVVREIQKNNNELFQDAFEQPVVNNVVLQSNDITLSDCEKLASLYSKERNAFFPYSKESKERKQFENELGIPSTIKTPPKGFIYLSIALIVLFIILIIIVIRKKAVLRIFIFSILLLSSSALLIYTVQKRNDYYGVSKGCTIFSIPEKTAEASSEINIGSIVEITEDTDNWFHVQLGETGGWCKKDDIIIIK